jgi:hypothetical protein
MADARHSSAASEHVHFACRVAGLDPGDHGEPAVRAVISASRQINTGDAVLVLIGGAESMSRTPWLLPKTERPCPAGDMALLSTTWAPTCPW